MIEIKLQFATVALAAAALNQLNGAQLATATITDTEKTAPAPGKPKAEKAAASPSAAPAAAPSPAATPAAAPAADKVDYPTLQKAVFALVGTVKAKGLDPVEHVLGIAKSFGYENFAAMKEDGPTGASKFAAALVAVNAKADELAAA